MAAGIEDASARFTLAATAYRYGDPGQAAQLNGLADALTPGEAGRIGANAAYHELEPFLHTVAADCSEQGYMLPLPPEMLEGWSQAHTREMARTAVIHYGAVKALGALDAAGVRAIPLKGFYLSSRVYTRKSARAFKDLDLLVEEASLADLHAALLDGGFEPAPGRPAFVPAPAYTVYRLPMEDGLTAMEIDVHIGMHWPAEYERRTALNAGDLWDGASPVEVEGMRLWALSAEHLFITTLLDAAVNHRYARLVKFRDALELLRSAEVDWGAVESWSRRWEVRSFVGPGLRYLVEIDPSLSIPREAQDSLMPSYATMRGFMRALPAIGLPDHRSRSFSPANLLFFMLSDTARERARGLLSTPSHLIRGRHRF
ncbi:MAG: nucleotidyltransferase family protein [Actinomycetota bacterium]